MTFTRQTPPHPVAARRATAAACRLVGVGALGAIVATAASGAAAAAAAPNALTAPASPASKTPAITLLPNDPAQLVLVGAGGGHVVADVANPAGGSTLYEITGGTSRRIAAIKGAVSTPTVGTGYSGEPEVVLQPCASQANPDARIHCKLRTYDLQTGLSQPLAGSDGATIGDEDHGRYVYATPTTQAAGTTVTLAPTKLGEERFVKLPVDAVLRANVVNPETGRPLKAGDYTEAPHIASIDIARGVVAATVEYRVSDDGSGGSLVLRSVRGSTSSSVGGWTVIARSTWGGASGISRPYRAATVTPTGIRTFYDGGDNDPSFVARWSAAGALLKKIATAGTHTPQIDDNAAFDGDRLITVPSVPYACQSDPDSTTEAAHCPVRSTGDFHLG